MLELVLTICLLLVYFVSAAGCHCFDLYRTGLHGVSNCRSFVWADYSWMKSFAAVNLIISLELNWGHAFKAPVLLPLG